MVELSAAAGTVTPALAGGSIAHAGDGTMWFSAGFAPNQIGRMTTAGVVSYPVTGPAVIATFNPGPLTRGPDGHIWFADPLAGIGVAGTIGKIDISTQVASEFATPLMKTTFQISASTAQISRRTSQINVSTSQDQSCNTATSICMPVATGTCVPVLGISTCRTVPTGPTPAGACMPSAANAGNGFTTTTCNTVPTGPTLVAACMPATAIAANAYTDTTCSTATTGPTLVAACTDTPAGAGNAFTSTSCSTATTGPTSVDSCSQTPPIAANSFIRIVCKGITPGSQAYVSTTGPDGNLWFTEYNGPRIGRFDIAAQEATEFGPLTAPATSITAGPDGNVWFAESSPYASTSLFGRVTPSGQITEFPTKTVNGTIVAMTTGADGNIWFAKNGFGGPAIGKIDPATGNVTLYTAGLTGAFTLFGGIAAAGDGNVWFTDYSDGLIGRITPSGTISLFGGVLPNVQLNAITAG
ncbi:MAG: hypothetical protein ABIZ18_07230, partial [Caldimonas sp.]